LEKAVVKKPSQLNRFVFKEILTDVAELASFLSRAQEVAQKRARMCPKIP